ncbi:MAG: Type 1 glutamine amidotransferase-like domain-containing protein [SAR202 cluster bacterium]|nr:Type 1 glutamine amidotransferase-like domain-containing protein [SAR202 cluster bacterium]
MPGQIALVGGDEFRSGCEAMDRKIMAASRRVLDSQTPDNPAPAKVVVVPTAAVTGPAKAANDGATYFGALGGDSSRLMLLERSQAEDPDFFHPATLADVVYFTGGSPEHLLETIRGSKFLTALLALVAGDSVLAGSSAGAMAMGAMMRRPRAGGWVEGLGVAPGIGVLPHHEHRDQAETSKELQQSAPSGLTYLGIDARTGCLGTPGNWRVVGFGRVTVYQGTDWQVFNAGDTLPTGF